MSLGLGDPEMCCVMRVGKERRITGPLVSQLKWWGFSDMANGMERQIQVEGSHRQLNSERRVEERDFQKRIKPSR